MKREKGIDGYVLVSTKDCKQVLSYHIAGVDSKCKADGPYPPHGCGIHMNDGATCEEPGTTSWDRYQLKEDPWLKVKYAAHGYTAAGEDVVVDTKLAPQYVHKKTIVLHDAYGERFACSQIVPVTLLYAPELETYPEADTELCVTGSLYVTTKDRYQEVTYDLEGLDSGCGEDAKHLPKNGCVIAIHEGASCEEVGEPHWDKKKFYSNPWATLQYHTHFDGRAWAKGVRVHTGLKMAEIVYKTVVIYDRKGAKISCSKLFPVKHLLTSKLEKYPHSKSNVDIDIEGSITLKASGAYPVITYNIGGVDEKCGRDSNPKALGCGIQVYEGTKCDAVGRIYWNRKHIHRNPWTKVRYYTLEDRTAVGDAPVHAGLSLGDMVGRSVVVHDYYARPAACAVLKPPKTHQPVCRQKRNGAVFQHTHHHECFPGNAALFVQGRGTAALEDVSSGDAVLVQKATGEYAFDKILGFSHSMSSSGAPRSSVIEIVYEQGTFRATGNHIIFKNAENATVTESVVSDIAAGDEVILAADNGSSVVKVLSARRKASNEGLYAPMTSVGTVVVDGLVASTYAKAKSWSVGHAAMHSSFFLPRAVGAITSPSGGSTWSQARTQDGRHSLAQRWVVQQSSP
eukprot:TRINITY_DN4683_c0_g1_i4.p1 TRINITY_DN4683_c0_g1~~TRINITY_DN4683_c0_g1_i4.p1  ORF type:complete len:625 (+),score=127.63 TRINITY_DN4683_c0_g1_i4:452-2326(+)